MVYVYCVVALAVVLAVSMLVPDSVKNKLHGWRKRSKQSQEAFVNLFGDVPNTSSQVSVRRVYRELRSAWGIWVAAKGSRNVFRVRRTSCDLRDKIAVARSEGYILPPYIIAALPELAKVLGRVANVRDPGFPHLASDTEQETAHRA